MSYPQEVPPGWTRGDPLVAFGVGPRYALGRDLSNMPFSESAGVCKEILITFDSREDANAWLKWWKQSENGPETKSEQPS